MLIVLGKQPAAQCDMTLARDLGRRELDRVTHQVRDDLAQTERIADELVGDVRVDVVGEV